MATYLKQATPQAEADLQAVRDTVTEILERVRTEGLEAVREYSRRFDDWDPPSFRVADEEIAAARDKLAPDVLASLEFAHRQIRHFAELQRASMLEFEEETRPGVFLGQKHIPVASVGAYVPSGKYPMLMSAQMSILTAKVAGVKRVVGCAPPFAGKGIYPEVLWSMHLAGADEIWAVGGVQALAMLAYGVEGLEPVDLIAGPGNMYVAEAKRQLFGRVGIDLLAGPTEILIIADEKADPLVLAADLLGQAEHGQTSPAVLVTTSRAVAEATLEEVDRQLPLLASAEVLLESWGCARRGHRGGRPRGGGCGRRPVRAGAPRGARAGRGVVRRASDQLRHALRGRRSDDHLQRQGHRHQSHAADGEGRPLHGRPLGRQVPQDGDLPALHAGGRPGHRAARRTAQRRGAVPGPRQVGPRSRGQVPGLTGVSPST